ncbi:MAG TPA: ABC transporter substrate-binding protein [Bacteriovoracaceae bacterium]|nr:ABC transporter substrate-binding protein [Bacteriovoracaceae bacterium]
MRISYLCGIVLLLASRISFALDTSLTVAIPNKISHLHPFESTTAQQTFILPLIYETLLVTEVNGDTQPNLITEWQIDEQKKSVSFKIRTDVRFSDNSLLVPMDVVESLRLACQHPLKSNDLSIIKGCVPYSEKQFGVSLAGDSIKVSVTTHPSYLLSKLAGDNILILKKSGESFIGTGPFAFQQLGKDELVLMKNKLHRIWMKDSWFNRVHFKFINDADVKLQVNANKVHVASMYLISTARTIHNKQYHTINHAPNVVQALALNRNVAPFNDSLLRKAIHRDIRSANLELCSSGSRKTYGFIPKGIGGSLDGLDTTLPDILVEKVRLKKKMAVKFPRHVGRRNPCEEEKLKEILARYNIIAEIVYYDDYESLDKAVLDPKVHGFLELYVFKTRDASSHLKKMVPENKQNFYLFHSSEIKSRLLKAWDAKDLRARFGSYKEINKIIFDSSSLIDLYAIGHANLIHKCMLKKTDDVAYYNPNSFLFLLKLDFSSTCNLGLGK